MAQYGKHLKPELAVVSAASFCASAVGCETSRMRRNLIFYNCYPRRLLRTAFVQITGSIQSVVIPAITRPNFRTLFQYQTVSPPPRGAARPLPVPPLVECNAACYCSKSERLREIQSSVSRGLQMRKLMFPAQRAVSSLLARSHRRFLSVAAPEPVISVYIDMKSPHSYLALQVG